MGNSRIRFILAILAVAAIAALMAGCGKSQVDTSTSMPTDSPTANTPAAGPAISTKLTFDQLALESPVKKITKKGLIFLQFAFAERDGMVYKCELPQAMSQGAYPYDEWIRTFSIYKLPQVIAKKKVTKKGQVAVGDFPFISPKPQPVPTTETNPTSQVKPINMPTLPAMPTPAGGAAQPGAMPMPGMMRGPMGPMGPMAPAAGK